MYFEQVHIEQINCLLFILLFSVVAAMKSLRKNWADILSLSKIMYCLK
jgi:hypothetical protein